MAPSLSPRSISSASFSHLKPNLAKAYSNSQQHCTRPAVLSLSVQRGGVLPGSLFALEERDKRVLLCVMLEELNNKFTLQQDQCPITDRSSQSSSESPSADTIAAVLAGGSHLSRLIDHSPLSRGLDSLRLSHLRKLCCFRN